MRTGARPEDVLDLHLAHLADKGSARVLEQLEHGGQGPHRDAAFAAGAHDAGAGHSGGRGDRDDDLVGLGLVEDARQIVLGVAADPHAVDPQPSLARIVVDEADRLQTQLPVALNLAQDQAPAVPRADDEHAASALARVQGVERPALVQRAHEHAHAGQEREHDQQGQRRSPRWAGRRRRSP